MTVSKLQKARAIEAANSELSPSMRERKLLKDRLALVVGTSALSAGALAATSASAAVGASGSVAAGGTKGIVGTLSLASKMWVTKIAAGALITGAGVYGAVHAVESYDTVESRAGDSRTGDSRADEKRGVKDGAVGSEAKTSGGVIEDEQPQPETHSLRASQASVRVSSRKMDPEHMSSARGVASARSVAKTSAQSEKTKNDLMEEVSLLEDIQLDNLLSSKSGQALAEHARRFLHGQLAHERRRLLEARRCLLAKDRVTADMIVEKSATLSEVIAEACRR